MNTRILCLLFIILCGGVMSCRDDSKGRVSLSSIHILPAPAEIKLLRGFLQLDAGVSLQVDPAFEDISHCTSFLRAFMEENHLLVDHPKAETFQLVRRSTLAPEAYELSVHDEGIQLFAASSSGVFYGLQTFCQLFLSTGNNIPHLVIKDAPRFPHRGLMLDPARSFIPLATLKQFVHIMSFYKFNRLHLHLTDDEGWCVEIKGVPLLSGPDIGSPTMDGGSRCYYTQEEMRELVAYAAMHQVEIIPEIEMPAHSSYLLSRYPFLRCGKTTHTHAPEQLCVSKEEVTDLLEVVVSEFASIFTSSDFHLGGDEYDVERMKSCETCRSKMEQQGFTYEEQLLADFFEQTGGIVKKHGKTPMFWQDADIPRYPSDATLYSWRKGHFSKNLSATQAEGNKLICAADEIAYLNYPQAWSGEPPYDNWGMPAIILRDIYHFDFMVGLTETQLNSLIGFEALLWNEYIKSIDLIYYMMYPRAFAFAELGWSLPETRDWELFCKKLDFHFRYLSQKGVAYRYPAEVF